MTENFNVDDFYDMAKCIYNKYKDNENLSPKEERDYAWAKTILNYVESISSHDMVKDIAQGNAQKFMENINDANTQIDVKISNLQREIDSMNGDYSKIVSIIHANENKSDQSRVEYIEDLKKSLEKLKKIIDGLVSDIKNLQDLKNDNIKLLVSFHSDSENFVRKIVEKSIGNPEEYLRNLVESMKRSNYPHPYDVVFNPSNLSEDAPSIIDKDGNINRPLLEIVMDYTTGRESENLSNIRRISTCDDEINSIEFSKKNFAQLKNDIINYLKLQSEYEKLVQDANMLGTIDRIFHKEDYNYINDRKSQKYHEYFEAGKNLSSKLISAVVSYARIPSEVSNYNFHASAQGLLDELGVKLRNSRYVDYNNINGDEIRETFIKLIQQSPEKYDEFIDNYISILDNNYSDVTQEKENCINELPDEYKDIRYDCIARLNYFYGGRGYWRETSVWNDTKEDSIPEVASFEPEVWEGYREAIRKLYILAVLDDFNKSKDLKRNDALGSNYKNHIVDSFSDAMNEEISKPISM